MGGNSGSLFYREKAGRFPLISVFSIIFVGVNGPWYNSTTILGKQ